MRVGEITGLRWCDIDLENETISVNHTLVFFKTESGKCRYAVNTPKTKAGAPVIRQSPLTMECSVADVYSTPNFENFICTIDNTWVAEEHLNETGKIDYETLKPVLFEFPTYQYLKTGDVLGKCLSFKKTPEQ